MNINDIAEKMLVNSPVSAELFKAGTTEELKESLIQLAEKHQLKYLLSYHDDGVIWGAYKYGSLSLSSDLIEESPLFRAISLKTCRMFGDDAELMVSDSGELGLQAFLLAEGSGDLHRYYEEQQLLWGDRVDECVDGFSILSEGSQGLRHAVPVHNLELGPTERVAVQVRHYIGYRDSQAYTKWSRLVDLKIVSIG